jgi:hypothetical protein
MESLGQGKAMWAKASTREGHAITIGQTPHTNNAGVLPDNLLIPEARPPVGAALRQELGHRAAPRSDEERLEGAPELYSRLKVPRTTRISTY